METVRKEAAKQCKTGIIELELGGRIMYIVPVDMIEDYVELNEQRKREQL
jgi:hypothetical protein